MKYRRGALLCVACALACAALSASAAGTTGTRAASAVETASGASGQGILAADALAPHFTGDDPEHVRDALAGHPAPGQSSSITSRVRAFLSHPFRKSQQGASAAAGASQARAQARSRSSSLFHTACAICRNKKC
jgi:hypothetical protein